MEGESRSGESVPGPGPSLQILLLSLGRRASHGSGLVFSGRKQLTLSCLRPTHTHGCHTGTHLQGALAGGPGCPHDASGLGWPGEAVTWGKWLFLGGCAG